MRESSKQQNLASRCRELEANVSLWMAANQAKAQRIVELEAMCSRLQQRVARLSRQAGQTRSCRLQKVRHAR